MESSKTKTGRIRVAKKKTKKKAKRKVYFGMEVQDAIVRYNDSNNDAERNKIYQEEIHKAFDKLCENIINTFKFTYFDDVFEDVKHETVAFLVMNMHKYDHTKGSKAFSYFSVVAKNYLILHNNANYKKYKIHTSTDILNTKRGEKINTEMEELIEEFISYLDNNISNIFKKKKDIDVAYAIVELMKRRQEIENFNKKALYILIREMANVETSHITKVVNVLKRHYKTALNQFYTGGNINNQNSSGLFKFFK